MENPHGTDRAVIDSQLFSKLTAELGLGLVSLKKTSGSTNTELAHLASTGEAGHLSVYFTEHQQAGKGRLGREWVTPEGILAHPQRPRRARGGFPCPILVLVHHAGSTRMEPGR